MHNDNYTDQKKGIVALGFYHQSIYELFQTSMRVENRKTDAR